MTDEKNTDIDDRIAKILIEGAEEYAQTAHIYKSAFKYALKNIDHNVSYKLEKSPEEEEYGITYEELIKDEMTRQSTVKINEYKYILGYIFIVLVIFGKIPNLFVSVFLGLLFIPVLMFFIKDHTSQIQRKFKEYVQDFVAYINWQQKLKRDFWLNLNGHQFEKELANLYRTLGYVTQVTKGSGDNGVDIILEKDKEKILVQCKAHKKPIGPAIARELYGTMHSFNVKKGIIASLGGFSKGVYKFVANKDIQLIGINEILNMTK